MKNPYSIVTDLEHAISDYTGAPHVVAVNSCSMAILLAVAWHLRDAANATSTHSGLPNGVMKVRQCPNIEIPKRTYVSVPMSIIHAGGRPTFRDEDWAGCYQLKPLPVWDSARWFTWGLWNATQIPGTLGRWFAPGSMVCVSFQAAKTLGDTQGGAILLDDPVANEWLRRARFDGRSEGVAPKDDAFKQIGWHCYMSNDVAARLLLKLHSLPRHNGPLPNDDYPDLSQLPIFKGAT